ncbi:CG16742 [Drosophila busckii]|uniref:CG16742 n=1 Tax=Drosophila busckii TaxID=30019 RepID=A0A0M3QUY1_DROBS|nr:WASH complex subunit 2 [Drosophila busckii]ALC41423.1 CG16742 [Drosophila busckii]
MDISADVASIVAQAPDWNFAGDCALLELMKRISQNLSERGEQTNQKMLEFERNVRRTDIALDNVTNSLRALQFGQQFVEYRVEAVEDDDFLMPEDQVEKPAPVVKSSQELAKEFMQNNLEMFRKNFETVTLEVPDSDEEDGAVDTTTVYRAKNPYDAIPLPYIIGSKEWEEHKYAGLYDSDENSEDDQQEQFSSSSSDEAATAAPQLLPQPRLVEQQQSDSSSSASLPKQMPRKTAAAASSIPAAPMPKTQPRPIITSTRNPHERDLFAAMRASPPSDDPPSSSSSLNSSPAISHRNVAAAAGLSRPAASLSSSSSSASRPNLAGRQTPPKLFDEPDLVTTLPAATEAAAVVKPAANASQIKRKSVNLFNDDEFHNFMSEIVDKVQSKTGQSSTPTEIAQPKQEPPKPAPTAVTKAPQKSTVVTKAVETPPKTINLFDDSPPLTPKPAQQAVAKATTLPTTLFDDNFDDDVDDFLSSFAAKPKAPAQQTPKTRLFDDDDDDLDIDDIFAKKTTMPSKPEQKLVAKTATLFDDEEERQNVEDILAAKVAATPKPKAAAAVAMKPNLFDDDMGDDDLFGTPKSSKNIYEAQEKVQPAVKNIPEPKVSQVEQKEKPVLDNKIVQPEVSQVKQQQKEEEPKLSQVEQQQQKEKPVLVNKIVEPKLSQVEEPKPKVVEAKAPANLFNDDFSDEEELTATHEINKPNIETTQAEANTEIIRDEEPANKNDKSDEDEVDVEVEAAPEPLPADSIMDDLFSKLEDDVEPTAAEQQGDALLNLVAELESGQTAVESPKPADLAAAQQIMQNYSSLFSDEPPDDSEFFQSLGTSSLSSLSASKIFDSEQDFFEPALPEVPNAAKTPAEQLNNSYGGMQLINDLPPDDVEAPPAANLTPSPSPPSEETSATTTRIHTIFYDDFSETTTANKAAQFAEPPAVEQKPASPVKKLQMPNIQINVKALLPAGAAKPKAQPKSVDKTAATAAAAATEATVKPADNKSEQVLSSINKTRVRGPPKRRPSTRRARQENYAKSLEEAEHQQSKAVELPKAKMDELVKTVQQSVTPKQSLATASKLAAAFLESDEDGDEVKPATVAAKQTVKPTATFLDSDNDDTDALFGPTKVQSAPQLKQEAAAKPPEQVLKTTKPAKLSALFLDSDEEQDDADLFFTTKPAAAAPTYQRPPQSTAAPKSYTSFLDNNPVDDDDAFFKAATAVGSSQPKDPSKLQQQATTKAAVAATQAPKPVSKLFDDSDDDDDLFASAVPVAKASKAAIVKPSLFGSDSEEEAPPKAPPKTLSIKSKPSKSLFSDDEDDDDLFGAGAKRSTASSQLPKPTPATQTAPKSEANKSSTLKGSTDNPLADLLGP